MNSYLKIVRMFPKPTLIALVVLIISGLFYSLYKYDLSLVAMFGLLVFYILSALNLKILAVVVIKAKLNKPMKASISTLFIGMSLQIIAFICGFIALAEVPSIL